MDYEVRNDETTNSRLRQFGQLVIAFNLSTQWYSRRGEQMETRASGRSP